MAKSSAIIASVLVAVFMLLHYFVYLDNASGEIPLIQSYTDAPVDLPELSLCEVYKPSYLNPFHKVQFRYQVEQNDTYTKCKIIEEAESLFSSKMQAIVGDPLEYWDGYDEDGFPRPLVGYTYANILFFLVQYFLAAAFVFVIIKEE